MKQVFKYDENGYYLEPILIEQDENNNYTLPENCTDAPLLVPNYKLQFNKTQNKWVETKAKPTTMTNPIWNGTDWVESPTLSPDKLTNLQNQLNAVQAQLNQAIQTNADLTLQLVTKGVL